jgi:hypothetical protein
MVLLNVPTEGQVVGTMATFRWSVANARRGEVYKFEVRLDKGINACDSGIEEVFDARNQTCFTANLNPAIYGGQPVEYGIRATDSRGKIGCTSGRTFSVDLSIPPPARDPCQ